MSEIQTDDLQQAQEPQVPNASAAAADAGSTFESGTASSVNPAPQGDGTAAPLPTDPAATAEGNGAGGASAAPASDASAQPATDGAAGDSGNAVGDAGPASAGSDASPSSAQAADEAQPAAAGDDAGNVPATGAPLAGTGGEADEHPIKVAARHLRQKLDQGEGIVLSEVVNLLHSIEETL